MRQERHRGGRRGYRSGAWVANPAFVPLPDRSLPPSANPAPTLYGLSCYQPLSTPLASPLPAIGRLSASYFAWQASARASFAGASLLSSSRLLLNNLGCVPSRQTYNEGVAGLETGCRFAGLRGASPKVIREDLSDLTLYI